MKITKARLKELIKEDLQSEVQALFAAKAKKEADKKKKGSKFMPQELSDKEKKLRVLSKLTKI